jgi:pyrimidine-specific ribonucleoside hydrolase
MKIKIIVFTIAFGTVKLNFGLIRILWLGCLIDPREVDDGITLIMAWNSQIEIVGLAITYVDYSYDIINKILKWHNKGLQFQFIKDHQKQMIWVWNDGTRALYEALKKKLTILALGPMTNIATDSESSWYYSANRENINLCSKNSWITV